ncbi:MAG: extracellular solute-binding protein [Blastochloris sp.]|nr:extracellular solute-binding protein [Blastochloris sp.]
MNWDREKILNSIGFTLLGACFAYSLFNVATRTAREQDEEVVSIRFAHWQLEAGIRTAFDAVANEYMKLHPNVRVEQILIPERVYPTWLTTRLVGQNPPDLVLLGIGMSDERLARYFVPLTSEVAKPNPYNKGTDLEQVAWRDTFVDGLVTSPGIVNLFDYYGVPNSVSTIRLFYNKPLYQKITGKTQPPRNYEELQGVFKAVQEYSKDLPDKQKVLAVAGSKYNSPILMDRLFASQTQKLTLALDRSNVLRVPTNPQIAFFDGLLDPRDPAMISALRLTRELGQNMQTGFISLAREDATFYFAQERALMITSGSFDLASLVQESDFEVGVAPIPLPDPQDPQFGEYVLGQTSEAETGTNVPFGLAQDSKHPEIALDFLKFMTSQPSNRLFSHTSTWLPSVVGVEVPEVVEPFEPIQEGYPGGIMLRSSGGSEVVRIYDNAFYSLVSKDGSVEKFMDLFLPQYPQAMLRDGKLALKNSLRNVGRHDTTLSALKALAVRGDDTAETKALRLAEIQARQETDYYQRRYAIWSYEQRMQKEKQ